MKTKYQFLLISSPPAKEVAFQDAKKKHGSTFAFQWVTCMLLKDLVPHCLCSLVSVAPVLRTGTQLWGRVWSMQLELSIRCVCKYVEQWWSLSMLGTTIVFIIIMSMLYSSHCNCNEWCIIIIITLYTTLFMTLHFCAIVTLQCYLCWCVQMHGAAYGSGIYLSPSLGTSFGYSTRYNAAVRNSQNINYIIIIINIYYCRRQHQIARIFWLGRLTSCALPCVKVWYDNDQQQLHHLCVCTPIPPPSCHQQGPQEEWRYLGLSQFRQCCYKVFLCVWQSSKTAVQYTLQ